MKMHTNHCAVRVNDASLLLCCRVYLQYHTWKQVLSGALVGFIFGSLWFALTYLIFTPVFPLVVSWWVYVQKTVQKYGWRNLILQLKAYHFASGLQNPSFKLFVWRLAVLDEIFHGSLLSHKSNAGIGPQIHHFHIIFQLLICIWCCKLMWLRIIIK
jgi:hypothetical protein